MAKKHQQSFQNSLQDSGYSDTISTRYLNKDGKSNVKKVGAGLMDRWSWYHTMLELPYPRFLLYLLVAFISTNLLFASLYYLIGTEHLTSIDRSSTQNEFIDIFFFSSQTFTTVGYGRIAPVGILASLLSTFEAFLGLLFFAVATGLFYGRFSRPRAFIRFSDNMLVAPYQDSKALMFRLVPYKNNSLTNAEVSVMAAIEEDSVRKFYSLRTELSRITSLSMNWTIVHNIDEKSPFYEFSQENFKEIPIEIIIHINAFDEVFSNTVLQKTSYINSEIIYGAKFLPMYYPSADKKTTVLDIKRLNYFEKVFLNNNN